MREKRRRLCSAAISRSTWRLTSSGRQQPPPENILTAIAVNERVVRSSGSDPTKRGIALSWLFHLIGDIQQPLHAVQLFSREYPNGDRGGIEICVRASLS